MPYDIKRNYGGCRGYAVVGPSGTHGCHTTRASAIQQQRALYAAENASKSSEQDMDKAESVSVGDHVMFAVPKPPDQTEYAHGVVERVERSGMVRLPGSNETEEASSDNPVAVVRVYATNENGSRTRTDRRVVKPFSSLRVSSEPIDGEKMHDKEDLEKVSAKLDERLKDLADKYNEGKEGDKRITVGTLRQVYNRGIGAYRTNPSSVRGTVSSAEQWAMGRVNAFMSGLRGRFPRKPFDLDLFPKGHPRSTKKYLFDIADELKDLASKAEEWEGKPLYDMLPDDEKAFADALLNLAQEIGPLDQAEGVWIGYEDGENNENASIGIKCGNCALHKSSIACAIISQQIEENGACRLAVIPQEYVNVSDDMSDDMMNDDMSKMYHSDNEDEDKWDNVTKACWAGYRQEGMKEKNGRMVPNCVPMSKSEDGVIGNDDTPNTNAHNMEDCPDPENCPEHSMDKRDYNSKERRVLARRGMALPDGSFPIVTVGDLRNAIQSVGRASNYSQARNHIIRRAEALGRTDLIPDEWKPKSSKKMVDMEKRAVSDIDLTPTESMASNARRGLELRAKFGRGGTAVGVARARDLANRRDLSPETVARMYSFFARHEVDKQGKDWDNAERPSNGKIAWLLWGGDSGYAWAKQKWQAIQNARKYDETWKDSPFSLYK